MASLTMASEQAKSSFDFDRSWRGDPLRMEPLDLKHVGGGGGDLSRSSDGIFLDPGTLFSSRVVCHQSMKKLRRERDPVAEPGGIMNIEAIAEDFARNTILPRAAWEKSRNG
jgi:hypothetical protein